MPNYFRYVPKFEYVTRNSDEQIISEYQPVKNLFKRAKLREDIFRDLSNFTKYQIIGNDRPDNVASKIYGDEKLDWVILLSNNIVNIQNEWPLTNDAFNEYLLNKYGTHDQIYATHHYETREVKNAKGNIIVPSGLQVPRTHSVTYYESATNQMITISNATTEVTNYQYEFDLDTKKRNIYVLKREFLNIVLNDMDDVMQYKKGGTQYVSPTMVDKVLIPATKRADNIRLYE